MARTIVTMQSLAAALETIAVRHAVLDQVHADTAAELANRPPAMTEAPTAGQVTEDPGSSPTE